MKPRAKVSRKTRGPLTDAHRANIRAGHARSDRTRIARARASVIVGLLARFGRLDCIEVDLAAKRCAVYDGSLGRFIDRLARGELFNANRNDDERDAISWAIDHLDAVAFYLRHDPKRTAELIQEAQNAQEKTPTSCSSSALGINISEGSTREQHTSGAD